MPPNSTELRFRSLFEDYYRPIAAYFARRLGSDHPDEYVFQASYEILDGPTWITEIEIKVVGDLLARLTVTHRERKGWDAAIDLAGDLVSAWQSADGTGVASLFTEDGMMEHPVVGELVGRPAIAAGVESLRRTISDLSWDSWVSPWNSLHGDFFEFGVEFLLDGEPWTARVVMGLEGDRVGASLIDHLSWHLGKQQPDGSWCSWARCKPSITNLVEADDPALGDS